MQQSDAPGGVKPQHLPYGALATFYFCYFALLGATLPYWSLYLEDLGFQASQIGLLLAIPMVSKIVAPGIWGWLADYTGQPLKIIRIGSICGCLSFALIFINQGAWIIACVIFLYSFFWNAILPQQEVLTLSFLKDKPQNYSRIRVWGSIGFIVTVLVCGLWFEKNGVSKFPLIAISLLAFIWLSSLLIPEAKTKPRRKNPAHFLTICKHPVVLSFLIAGCLLQVSHGVYYSFFSIYLESYGYSRSTIGLFWSVGVISEVFVFMLMHKAILSISLRHILLGSLMIAFIRWLLIGHLADNIYVLFMAQTFHAFTYGAFHAGAIETIRRLFVPAHQGKGQAIYSGLSFGLGGAIGSVAGGFLWDINPVLSFNFAALASLLAFLAIYRFNKNDRLN